MASVPRQPRQHHPRQPYTAGQIDYWLHQQSNAELVFADDYRQLIEIIPELEVPVEALHDAQAAVAFEAALEDLIQDARDKPMEWPVPLVALIQRVAWDFDTLTRLRSANRIRARIVLEARVTNPTFLASRAPSQRLNNQAADENSRVWEDEEDEDELELGPGTRRVFMDDTFRMNPATLHEGEAECSICREPYLDTRDDGVFEFAEMLKCGHVFGNICIDTWIQGTGVNATQCPLCRQALEVKIVRLDRMHED